jgi:hypothetical protein
MPTAETLHNLAHDVRHTSTTPRSERAVRRGRLGIGPGNSTRAARRPGRRSLVFRGGGGVASPRAGRAWLDRAKEKSGRLPGLSSSRRRRRGGFRGFEGRSTAAPRAAVLRDEPASQAVWPLPILKAQEAPRWCDVRRPESPPKRALRLSPVRASKRGGALVSVGLSPCRSCVATGAMSRLESCSARSHHQEET